MRLAKRALFLCLLVPFLVLNRYAFLAVAMVWPLAPWFVIIVIESHVMHLRGTPGGYFMLADAIGMLVAVFVPAIARPRRRTGSGWLGHGCLAVALLFPVLAVVCLVDVTGGHISRAVDPEWAWMLVPDVLLKILLIFVFGSARPPAPGESPSLRWRVASLTVGLMPPPMGLLAGTKRTLREAARKARTQR